MMGGPDPARLPVVAASKVVAESPSAAEQPQPRKGRQGESLRAE